MTYTLETIDTVKCSNCPDRRKDGKGYYCEKHYKQLEHYRDRSGVWVTKCDACICGHE